MRDRYIGLLDELPHFVEPTRPLRPVPESPRTAATTLDHKRDSGSTLIEGSAPSLIDVGSCSRGDTVIKEATILDTNFLTTHTECKCLK